MSSPMPVSTPSIVAVEPVRDDVRASIRRCLEAAEWKRVIPQGAKVALKVNLGWDLFIPGSITSPLFVEALIHEIRDHVGKIYMVEADQVLEDIEKAFHGSGMADVCRRTGVEWVNMSRGGSVEVAFPNNAVLPKIAIPNILRDALLVTVPVMKTHAKTGITGSLKNQWGCLPKMRHEYHLVLDDALADLNSAMRPVFAVMDATVGLEGNGPKSGNPRVIDRVLASADPVALDTIQAIFMGIDPATVKHLATCAARGIGTNDRKRIEVRGANPEAEAMRFQVAHHNAVSLVETLLRQSFLKKLFFNTPIFSLCLFGAKNYYRLWSWSQSKRCFDLVLSHPVYGPQWKPGWKGLESGR